MQMQSRSEEAVLFEWPREIDNAAQVPGDRSRNVTGAKKSFGPDDKLVGFYLGGITSSIDWIFGCKRRKSIRARERVAAVLFNPWTRGLNQIMAGPRDMWTSARQGRIARN